MTHGRYFSDRLVSLLIKVKPRAKPRTTYVSSAGDKNDKLRWLRGASLVLE